LSPNGSGKKLSGLASSVIAAIFSAKALCIPSKPASFHPARALFPFGGVSRHNCSPAYDSTPSQYFLAEKKLPHLELKIDGFSIRIQGVSKRTAVGFLRKPERYTGLIELELITLLMPSCRHGRACGESGAKSDLHPTDDRGRKTDDSKNNRL
jgi:hypothetical protein